MTSTPKFDKIYEQVMEQNVAAPGGVFGDNAGTGVDLAKSSDTYAPGDARLPKALGKVQKRSFPESIFDGKKKKVRKKKQSANPGPLKEEKESIKGGLADGMSLKDIADKHNVEVSEIRTQYEMGVKVEMEHTENIKQAQEISKDHLEEDPKYYSKLKDMEQK